MQYDKKVLYNEEGFELAVKDMENGEERVRLTLPDDSSMSSTVCGDWVAVDGGVLQWQDTHSHKGLHEVYICERGIIIIVSITRGAELSFSLLEEPGSSFVVKPGIDHNVLLSPGAHISTRRFGDAISNPNKHNNDWWPPNQFGLDQQLKTITLGKLAWMLGGVDYYHLEKVFKTTE